jgi:hypothetical protein
MRFTEDGWEVIPPLSFEPSDMMLLSKHEISVLAKRPKLKQFIFDEESRTDRIMSDWERSLAQRRADRKAALRRRTRRDYVDVEAQQEEADREYRGRGVREEIQRVALVDENKEPETSATTVRVITNLPLPRRRLDESLVTEASFIAADDSSESVAMEDV